MTVIELPDEQAAALKAKAAAEGLSLEAWLDKLAGPEPAPPASAANCGGHHYRQHAQGPARNHGDHARGRRKPARSLHLRLAQKRGMTALFADTFYWVALADFTDSAHWRALALTSERAASRIVTTDEVLAEYLTFFSAAPEPPRSRR
jgi:hypothetical protein